MLSGRLPKDAKAGTRAGLAHQRAACGALAIALAVLAQAVAVPAAAGQAVVDQLLQALVPREVVDARKSVVTIEFQSGWAPARTLVGSGVVMDAEGHVLTAGLPADGFQGRLLVTDPKGLQRPAHWLGFDEQTGLTLLSVPAEGLPALPLAAELPGVAEAVFVLGGSTKVIQSGTVTGLRRTAAIGGKQYGNLLEFSGRIRPGDSGALLTNAQGKMIGIVRGRLTDLAPAADGGRLARGVAVPVDAARCAAQQLAGQEAVGRPYLGLEVQELPAAKGPGVLVLEVIADGPAAAAGLQPGDILRVFHDQPLLTLDDLAAAVQASDLGERRTLQIHRRGQTRTVQLVIGQVSPVRRESSPRPAQPEQRSRPADRRLLLGVETQDLDRDLQAPLKLNAKEGALVVDVVRDSPAQRAGLRPMDVVVLFDNRPVTSSEELVHRVVEAGPGKTVTLEWLRDGQALRGKVALASPQAPRVPRQLFPDGQSRAPVAAASRLEVVERRLEELERLVRALEQRLGEAEAGRPSP